MADKNFLTDIIDADLAEGKISEIHTHVCEGHRHREPQGLSGLQEG